MPDLSLKCDCKKVQGKAQLTSPSDGVHIICYCLSCQAFANYLQDKKIDSANPTASSNAILDINGGTEIFQLPAAHISIDQGKEQVKCLRLSEKGVYRWYTQCCNTPIGNTMGPSMSFVGLIHNFVDLEKDENALGPLFGLVHKSGAIGTISDDIKVEQTSKYIIMPKIISKLVIWKIKGLHKLSAFFDSSDKPISEPLILN